MSLILLKITLDCFGGLRFIGFFLALRYGNGQKSAWTNSNLLAHLKVKLLQVVGLNGLSDDLTQVYPVI